MTWYVVADKMAVHEDGLCDKFWTLSRNPKECGWETDSGCVGYGLTKNDAVELANAANETKRLRQQNAELVEVLKLALASHGVVLTSDPPQDAWKANGVAEKARAAIAKATGCE